MTNQRLAFIFPGQGSQRPGMLADLAQRYPEVGETFAEASEVLGYDLWDLSQSGGQEELNLTERTQPLMLTASVAVWRIWCRLDGARPALFAGHSLGEWSALVCSGSVALADAVGLVRNRGAYMQEAVPAGTGAMAAIIGLDDDAIAEACRQASQQQVVSAVNYNAPGQVVIAGNAEAVARAVEACKQAGAKRAMPLPVSAPFHTSLMKPAADRLAPEIMQTTFKAPGIPIIHNVTLASETQPEAIQKLLIEQIYRPVPWVKTIETLSSHGIDTLVECGAGKVLSGLTKRIDKALTSVATEDSDNLAAALEATR